MSQMIRYSHWTTTLAATAIAAGISFVCFNPALADSPQLTEVRTWDGSGNTIGGAAGTALFRKAAAAYPGNDSGEKIKSEPYLPNARDVSNLIAFQTGSVLNERHVSDMLWAFGQFVDHDIDLTPTHPDNGTADIAILDEDDPLGPNPIPLDRSDFDPDTGTPHNPRQQINAITAFIDASNVYGSSKERADALRTFQGGRLKTSPGNLLPFNEDGLPNAGGTSDALFLAGDVRANEHVGLTSLHTLFMREHNRLAGRIAQCYPDADDEEIYQTARKIVGAEIQIITYNEFLPALLGPYAPSLDDYQGWDPEVDPSIANEFSTAQYRFGHSMLSANLLLADEHGPVGAIPLRDAFFHPAFLADNPENVDLLLRGFTEQQAQEIDTQLVDDVRNFLFGPPGAGGLDLASLNIQRGRDHGLPSYNVVREAYGLPAAEDFDDISSDPATQLALAALYDSVDEIDPWVGGLAEDHLDGASVGPLVAAAIVEQFTALRDGDRFFYLNDPDLAQQKLNSVIHLEQVTLADVISKNTGVSSLPGNIFFVPED
jgi:peroxidase